MLNIRLFNICCFELTPKMQSSVIIIEDEFIIAEDIKAALFSHGYNLFGIARSYPQAMELLKKGKPDLALVDITLNGEQSGLELGKMFSYDLNIPYIYVTSHSDISTMEKVKLTNPTGFLLKPFKRTAVFTAIEVALMNFKNRNVESNDDEQTILVRKGEEKIKVRFSEVLFLESDGNYTHIQTVTSKFTERKTLKDMLEGICHHPFVRVHKSYAVNKNKIHHYTREKIAIGVYDIPIGRIYSGVIN